MTKSLKIRAAEAMSAEVVSEQLPVAAGNGVAKIASENGDEVSCLCMPGSVYREYSPFPSLPFSPTLDGRQTLPTRYGMPTRLLRLIAFGDVNQGRRPLICFVVCPRESLPFLACRF